MKKLFLTFILLLISITSFGAIDAQSTWDSTFSSIPLVSDSSWTTNISDWVDARVTGKAIATGLIHIAPPFTFNKATFKSQLDALSPTASKATGATNFATAWETAILASTYITLPGDGAPNTGQATTWSSVASSIIDPTGIATAKAQLITDLTNAPLEEDVANSVFPKAFRDAFLNLTISVAGLNSLPIPAPFAVVSAPLL